MRRDRYERSVSGALLLAAYGVISCAGLRLRLRGSAKEEGNIFISPGVSTPFILGLIRPGIYLPPGLTAQERELILAHERSHIRALDHLSKPLAFLILSVHWFNPLVWAAYLCFCRDTEIACDERVISDMSAGDKKAYARVLLQFSLRERLPAASPTAFGETAVKERIREILRYRKPSSAVTVLCGVLIFAAVAAACVSQSPVSVNESAAEASGTPELPDSTGAQLSEYTQRLLALQNEMYYPPLSDLYDKQKHPDRESDRVIFDITEKLAEMCYGDEATQKQAEIYNEIFREREGDSPYRQIIKALLFPEDHGEEQDIGAVINKFRNRVRAERAELEASGSVRSERELTRQAVEDILKKEAHGEDNTVGSRYCYLESVLAGETAPDSPRITLPQVMEITERSHQQQDPGGYIYAELCKIQKYPDVDFTGSGVYGNVIFYLAGRNETLILTKSGYGYEPITFSVTGPDGSTCIQRLTGMDYPPWDTVWQPSIPGEAQEQEQSDIPKEPRPSPEAVGLLKYTFRYADNYAERIRRLYPGITREQMDEILILYDLAAPFGGSYAYRVSIAAGKTDPASPKLTAEAARRIIKEAPDLPEPEGGDRIPLRGVNYNILSGIYAVQYYPDMILPDAYIYWPGSSSPTERTEEIVVKTNASSIIYNRYAPGGELIYTEVLFEGENN